MAVAVDTNVVIDFIAGTPEAVRRAAQTLSHQGSRSALVISPVVYSELYAHPGWGRPEIDDFLASTAIGVDWRMSRDVWELAGNVFSAYAQRRKQQRAGLPRRLLADFVIGAHATISGGLITGDRDFYATNFPALRLIDLAEAPA